MFCVQFFQKCEWVSSNSIVNQTELFLWPSFSLYTVLTLIGSAFLVKMALIHFTTKLKNRKSVNQAISMFWKLNSCIFIPMELLGFIIKTQITFCHQNHSFLAHIPHKMEVQSASMVVPASNTTSAA